MVNTTKQCCLRNERAFYIIKTDAAQPIAQRCAIFLQLKSRGQQNKVWEGEHEETDEAVFEKKSVRRLERGNDPDGIIHVCHHCVCGADGRGK